MSQVKKQSSSAPHTTAPKPETNLDDTATPPPPEEPPTAVAPPLDGSENRSSTSLEAYENETSQLTITGSPPDGPVSQPDGLLGPNSWETKAITENLEYPDARSGTVSRTPQSNQESSSPHVKEQHQSIAVRSREDQAILNGYVEQRTYHTRRLLVMKTQLARIGESYAPSGLILDIEDTSQAISELDVKIEAFRLRANTLPGKEISIEKQLELLQFFAATLGISVEDIALIDIVLGSIIMTLRLPLAAAGRLLALHRSGHPQLASAGVLDVQLLDDTDEAAKQLVERVAENEQARLQAADPIADTDTHLLLQALDLATTPQRRVALQTRLDKRLVEQQNASLSIPDIAVPVGHATLRVTLKDTARKAA